MTDPELIEVVIEVARRLRPLTFAQRSRVVATVEAFLRGVAPRSAEADEPGSLPVWTVDCYTPTASVDHPENSYAAIGVDALLKYVLDTVARPESGIARVVIRRDDV